MTTRTSSGSSSDYSQSGVVPGSSTGAPAAPSTAASSNYNKNIPQQYNPATGTGYNPHGTQQQGSSSTANGNANVTTGTTGGGFGRRVERVLAGIHGAGESLRGTVGVAIDRAFGDREGVKKNEAIAKEGEYEVQSGNIASSTKAREGMKRNNR